jgi:hypothetical protein
MFNIILTSMSRSSPCSLSLIFYATYKSILRKWGTVTSESQYVRRKIIINIAECRDTRQLLIHNAVGFLVSGNKMGPIMRHTITFAHISAKTMKAN